MDTAPASRGLDDSAQRSAAGRGHRFGGQPVAWIGSSSLWRGPPAPEPTRARLTPAALHAALLPAAVGPEERGVLRLLRLALVFGRVVHGDGVLVVDAVVLVVKQQHLDGRGDMRPFLKSRRSSLRVAESASGALGVGTSSFPGFKTGMGVREADAGTAVPARHQHGALLFPLEAGWVQKGNLGTRKGAGSNCTLGGAAPGRETLPLQTKTSISCF